MFSSFTDPVKITLSALLGAVAGSILTGAVLVVAYNGISLPLVGSLYDGIIQTKVTAAKQGLVDQSQVITLQEMLRKERDARKALETANAVAQQRAQITAAAEAASREDVVTQTTQAQNDGLEGWSPKELEWLEQHRR